MNIDALKKLLGDVVEEKLREVLPAILDEYFASGVDVNPKKKVDDSIKSEIRQRFNEAQKSSVRGESLVTQPDANKPPVQYVKNNPILNQILNETVVRIKQEGQMVSGAPSTMTTEAPSVLDRVESVPKVVADALTRDYSQLFKLSKTKRG